MVLLDCMVSLTDHLLTMRLPCGTLCLLKCANQLLLHIHLTLLICLFLLFHLLRFTIDSKLSSFLSSLVCCTCWTDILVSDLASIHLIFTINHSHSSSSILPFYLRLNLFSCLLYTSDAADEEDSVDLGGRRIIK